MSLSDGWGMMMNDDVPNLMRESETPTSLEFNLASPFPSAVASTWYLVPNN